MKPQSLPLTIPQLAEFGIHKSTNPYLSEDLLNAHIDFIHKCAKEHITNSNFVPLFLSIISKQDIQYYSEKDCTDNSRIESFVHFRAIKDTSNPAYDVAALYQINEHGILYLNNELYATGVFINIVSPAPIRTTIFISDGAALPRLSKVDLAAWRILDQLDKLEIGSKQLEIIAFKLG